MAAPTHDVTFPSSLPGDAAAQSELADLVRQALSALPGVWTVEASPGARPGALIVTTRRDDGFECTVFVDAPMQRTALYLRDQVVNALQLHVLGIPRPPTRLPKTH